ATADPELAAKVPVLDLFVTATDLNGRVVSAADSFGQQITQVRNQHMFHLKKRTVLDQAPVLLQAAESARKLTRGYRHNDFLDDSQQVNALRDRVLAKVGRATSAFPAALPPQKLTRTECQEARLAHLMPADERDEVWFSDGGILMNKPFAPVVKTIFQRSADRPVDRVLLWLDPDPQMPKASSQPGPVPEPHLLQILMAPLDLPRNEDVAAYMEQVQRQNQYRSRVLQGFQEVERVLAQQGGAGADSPVLRGYRQMRAMQVFATLQATFARALADAAGAGDAANRLVEHLRIDLGLGGDPTDWRPDGLEELLTLWDPEYHARRLHYLLLQLDPFAEGADGEERWRRQALLGTLQPAFWTALEDWRNAQWVMANALTQEDDPALNAAFRALGAATGILEQAAALTALREYLVWVRDRAAAEEARAWQAPAAPERAADRDLRQRLQATSAHFEARDLLLFPLTQFGHVAEWDPIDMIQFAPGPAQHVKRTMQQKLASEQLGHFGGFLEERWRQNDILWGRLDAAEMIGNLVMQQARKRLHGSPALLAEVARAAEACVAQRHREILREEAEIVDLAKLEARYQQMRQAQASMAVPAPESLIPPAWEAAVSQLPPEAQDAFRKAVGEQASATREGFDQAYPPGLKGRDLLAKAPIEVLWSYLTLDHAIGEEKLGSVRKSVVITGLLGGLHNLIIALNRNTTGLSPVFLALKAGAVGLLKPLLLVLRLLLPWAGRWGRLAWGSTMAGAVLLVLQWLYVVNLSAAGWVVTGLLFVPALIWLVVSRAGRLLVGVAAAGAVTAALAGGLYVAGRDLVSPLGALPAPASAAVFLAVALLGTLLMSLGKVPGGLRSIVAFELAGSLERANWLLSTWREKDPGALTRAALQLGADYVFILGYAPLLALLSGLGALQLGAYWQPLATFGVLVAWGQLLAGLLDMVEDLGLIQVLAGTRNEAWPRLARYCAQAKFSLVGLGITVGLFGLYALVQKLVG
ncbi:MAG TPA: DUF3376 domain-containing protein, partial [Symbiobacteriaceae bacterium]|nr:DUF3376 domain-containing protein [Symbiobacteriaceae bacterium]